MSVLRPCRAVIFDMDGVLLDTEPLYTQATNTVLAPFGQRLTWELKRQIMGRDPLFGAELVLSSLDVALEPLVYLEQVDAELRRLLVDTQAMPGAEQWLSELRGLEVPIAVGTSSSRERFELKTRRHLWLRQVSPIICGDDQRVESRKPAPDIFLAAATDLGVAPAHCVVFEDAPSGVAAARAAGMQVVAIAAEGVGKEALAQADVVISGYSDLCREMFQFLKSGDCH